MSFNKNITPAYIQQIFQSKHFTFLCTSCLDKPPIIDLPTISKKLDYLTLEITKFKSIATHAISEEQTNHIANVLNTSNKKLFSEALSSNIMTKSITNSISNQISINSKLEKFLDLILTDNNKENTYSNKSEVIKLFKSTGNLVQNADIISITELNTNTKNIDNHTNNIKTSNKYIIKLSNIDLKIALLRNKKQLKDTNVYINEKISKDLNFLFYKTRNLKKTNMISGTWIFRNELFIKTNDNNKINITCLDDLIKFDKTKINVSESSSPNE